MISIKNFTATDDEFKELARIDNLVNHDSIAHPDEDKNEWNIRDKSIIRDRLLLYIEDILVGVMYYSQGRDENNKTRGSSHLLEHMLFKGTKKRPSYKKISNQTLKIISKT